MFVEAAISSSACVRADALIFAALCAFRALATAATAAATPRLFKLIFGLERQFFFHKKHGHSLSVFITTQWSQLQFVLNALLVKGPVCKI